MTTPLWLQRLTHKWERKLKDPDYRKKWLKLKVAKILANMAKNAHRNEEEPWND